MPDQIMIGYQNKSGICCLLVAAPPATITPERPRCSVSFRWRSQRCYFGDRIGAELFRLPLVGDAFVQILDAILHKGWDAVFTDAADPESAKIEPDYKTEQS
jgi:hypothetical protein